ncbi:cell envelope integrity protein TolA, partial [Acinetobacter baumannii]|uniref:cell envelope integrity protein TolA n=1 Tax=Acinetobacter baumannii TaxID=470 RepID=UPI001AECA2C4
NSNYEFENIWFGVPFITLYNPIGTNDGRFFTWDNDDKSFVKTAGVNGSTESGKIRIQTADPSQPIQYNKRSQTAHHMQPSDPVVDYNKEYTMPFIVDQKTQLLPGESMTFKIRVALFNENNVPVSSLGYQLIDRRNSNTLFSLFGTSYYMQTEAPNSVNINQQDNGDVIIKPLLPGGASYPEGTEIKIKDIETPIIIDKDGNGRISNDLLPNNSEELELTATKTEKEQKPSDPVKVNMPAKMLPTVAPENIEFSQIDVNGNVTIKPTFDNGKTYPEGTKITLPGMTTPVIIGANGTASIPNVDLPIEATTGKATVQQPNSLPSSEVDVTVPSRKDGDKANLEKTYNETVAKIDGDGNLTTAEKEAQKKAAGEEKAKGEAAINNATLETIADEVAKGTKAIEDSYVVGKSLEDRKTEGLADLEKAYNETVAKIDGDANLTTAEKEAQKKAAGEEKAKGEAAINNATLETIADEV